MLIYRAHNTKTGKSYIGQTVQSLSTRKHQHLRDSFCKSPKSHFHKSLKRNGRDVWEWTILYEAKNYNDLNRKESYYIGLYNSIDNGYNTLFGGGNTPRAHKETHKETHNWIDNLFSWVRGIFCHHPGESRI